LERFFGLLECLPEFGHSCLSAQIRFAKQMALQSDLCVKPLESRREG